VHRFGILIQYVVLCPVACGTCTFASRCGLRCAALDVVLVSIRIGWGMGVPRSGVAPGARALNRVHRVCYSFTSLRLSHVFVISLPLARWTWSFMLLSSIRLVDRSYLPYQRQSSSRSQRKRYYY
jgi:hypothetical protein